MEVLVSEASLHTVAVEVETIKINGKQLTLAVFRQIPEQFPEPDDNPIIWGTVNYHTKDCTYWPHYHVVWQKGALLRKFDLRKRELNCGLKADSDMLSAMEEDLSFGKREELVEIVFPNILWNGKYAAVWKEPLTRSSFKDHKAYTWNDSHDPRLREKVLVYLNQQHCKLSKEMECLRWHQKLRDNAESSPQLFIAV